MATHIMFGKYSYDSIKQISAKRTEKATNLVEKYGGQVNGMYALLGEYDLLLIVDFPGSEQAIKASLALNKMTGISFTTSPAVTVEEFDRMIDSI